MNYSFFRRFQLPADMSTVEAHNISASKRYRSICTFMVVFVVMNHFRIFLASLSSVLGDSTNGEKKVDGTADRRGVWSSRCVESDQRATFTQSHIIVLAYLKHNMGL